MITKEQYEYYQQYRGVLDLFQKTGEYVGGCQDLFSYMKVTDLRCVNCLSSALITAHNQITEYERNLSSVPTPRQRRKS